MNTDRWIAGVAENTGFAWRAEIIAPAAESEALNRALNEAWNDQGNNVSVHLSTTGQAPATHFGGSAWVSGTMLAGLHTALRNAPRAFALIREGNDGPIVTVLGHPQPRMIGEQGHFWELARKLDLHRLPEGPV